MRWLLGNHQLIRPLIILISLRCNMGTLVQILQLLMQMDTCQLEEEEEVGHPRILIITRLNPLVIFIYAVRGDKGVQLTQLYTLMRFMELSYK